ncbi:hypothetical protein F5B19DRAFT_488019 [Rostrohypoxylon terebratum]|nr:hypothetical protein F5B19DRAFT_488019 [Rostrohypoxylon terebratum]
MPRREQYQRQQAQRQQHRRNARQRAALANMHQAPPPAEDGEERDQATVPAVQPQVHPQAHPQLQVNPSHQPQGRQYAPALPRWNPFQPYHPSNYLGMPPPPPAVARRLSELLPHFPVANPPRTHQQNVARAVPQLERYQEIRPAMPPRPQTGRPEELANYYATEATYAPDPRVPQPAVDPRQDFEWDIQPAPISPQAMDEIIDFLDHACNLMRACNVGPEQAVEWALTNGFPRRRS